MMTAREVLRGPHLVLSTFMLILMDGLQIKLYRVLGPEKAPFATPKMFEGGEVRWFSYIDGAKGEEGMSSSLFLFFLLLRPVIFLFF
jgi:hypothetical protein